MANITPEHAVEIIGAHVKNQLRYELPSVGTVRQILERPFVANGIGHESVREADANLYVSPSAPGLRRGAIIAQILARGDIAVELEDSRYSLFVDEATREEMGGIDSAVALAVTIKGLKAWLTIANYHMYTGDEDAPVVARYRGKKILGPGLLVCVRPSKLSPSMRGAKHFPDTEIATRLEWHPVLDTDPEILREFTGMDIGLFQ